LCAFWRVCLAGWPFWSRFRTHPQIGARPPHLFLISHLVGSSEERSENAMSHDEEGSDVNCTKANEKEVRLEYKCLLQLSKPAMWRS
jgi:hypothetical protein